MKIAVIILNYNTSFDCRKCVSFLKKQQGVELEIIIVDNCSCEEDLAQLRLLCKEQQCTLIENKENRGYNAGNNVGLRYAANKGYEYALIANPDMEFPQTNYIIHLISAISLDPNIAIVGSDIVSPEGVHQNPQREASYWEELLWFWTLLLNLRSKEWFSQDYNISRECEKISGCCLIVRIDFIREIGFFDEKVFLYCEESILLKQIKQSKMKCYYLSMVQAVHAHIKSSKGDSNERMKVLFTSRNYYLRNYSGYTNIKLWLLLFSKRIQILFINIYASVLKKR